MKNENKFKSIEAERFISSIILLIEQDFAKSFKEVAEKVGKSSQDFTDIKSGKKDLQRNFLNLVSERYPINEMFVLTGEGPMLKTKHQSTEIVEESKNSAEYFKMKTELLQELIKGKDELIEMLKEKLKEFESRKNQ